MNGYGCGTIKLYLQNQDLELSLLIPALYFESRLGYTGVCICQNPSNKPCKICSFHYVSFTLRKKNHKELLNSRLNDKHAVCSEVHLYSATLKASKNKRD